MARGTKIEWADSTWSGWWGCTEISEECWKCYAREGTGGAAWGKNPRVRTSPKYWREPIYWNADAPRFQREHGHRERVFGDHICDWFDNQVDPQWRADAFKLVRETPNLDWQILTKRPQNIAKMLPPDWGNGYHNVWLGISAGNQDFYVQRWPILATIPVVKRFVSYEPALGPLGAIDIGVGVLPDWIIVGGESGTKPREMDLQWARDVRDQCARLGIAYFFKQTTGKRAIPPDLFVRQFPQERRR
jgi:protein gp37